MRIRFHSFDHTNYADFNSTTDAAGTVDFTLPQGDHRFRADLDGVQFWSGNVDHCMIPGCEAATVAIPGGLGSTTTTIDYTYDPLKRSNPGAKRRATA
ncbi:MAG: hypothetical protein R3300_13940 [Candidatus Promineifilaceae bacterium]|nr:hypothetical protein [Candidatus Promineifilaceae bacterium]